MNPTHHLAGHVAPAAVAIEPEPPKNVDDVEDKWWEKPMPKNDIAMWRRAALGITSTR